MAIVSTAGGSLRAISSYAAPALAGSGSYSSSASWWTEADPATYAALYRTQPNVRKCVDFLARNIAQLGIHVYRRVSDTDRVRLTDHQLADWLNHPTPFITRYRTIESLVCDLGIYWNAYWLKVRLPDRIGLLRLPPEQMSVSGGLVPTSFFWTQADGTVMPMPPSEVVHFHGYNVGNPLAGLSPLETLRRILMEDTAATSHRESFWRNAARIEGVVERPLAAKAWAPEQVESFRAQWRAKFTGEAAVGAVPVLQEGMTFKSIAFSPRQAEYTAVRKLTGEETASAYHIPLPMVGILDHATFANIREQHKQLYSDCLGPWLVMLAEDIERQVLSECRDTRDIYVEFNIAEKLTGSFEEQANSLQALVGRPIMTANEGRARLNLPSIDDPGADQLARPLNTTTDAASASDAPPVAEDVRPAAVDIVPVLQATWARQARVLARTPDAAAFNEDRWNRELADDLVPAYRAAGYDIVDAALRAAQLARVVNSDTRFLLLTLNRAAAFEQRKAEGYVP